MSKPRLYIHVGQATHFLRWEIPEFAKYFTIVDKPDDTTVLLSFGPDVLEEASALPALKRFATLFPGFGHNPTHNLERRKAHHALIKKFDGIFINPGPLEIAYKGLENISLYPFSVDIDLIKFKSNRKRINSLVHVSNDGAQKDWQRSEEVMRLTGLKYEVYPPREHEFYQSAVRRNERANKLRKLAGIAQKQYLPYGYVNHEKVIKKYQQYDGFVHVASDVKHPDLLDGKYTASLIEAGLTGAILFWHDTFSLGNGLETVFNLSVEPKEAARQILEIKNSIDVEAHSKRTRQEMIETFNPQDSVLIRAKVILAHLN